MLINGVVGDQLGGIGTNPPVRQGYTGELSVGDRHGRYMEATLRGNVYSVTFAAAALAVASATSAGAFLLNNPAGSGKNLVLQDIQATMTANTPVATGTAIVLGAIVNPVFSALGTAVTPFSTLVGSGNKSVAAAYPSGTYAVLPSITPSGLRQVGGWYIDLAASESIAYTRDEVAGMVVVQPGCAVNLYGLGGTPADLSITATMVWEEVPIAS